MCVVEGWGGGCVCVVEGWGGGCVCECLGGSADGDGDGVYPGQWERSMGMVVLGSRVR